MMREIYMISILQLQGKGFSLPRNWQPLAVFSILYVMFLCSLERIGCHEWKETLHLISGMNLDWKLLCRTSVKSLGPLPSLCLWMKRHEPHALLLLPPSWGLRPSLCWGDWGTSPSLVKRPWPRKAFSAINALLERSQLRFPSCHSHSWFLNQLMNQWRGSPPCSSPW